MTGKTAVIIGGSMAGLLAARVLDNHFDHVVIIERDELPDGALERNGAPQGKHVHALLSRGQDLLEKLFPGLSDELTAGGAPRMTWCRDTCYFTPGGWIKRFDSQIQTNVITRPDLEYRVRRRTAASGKLQILTGRDVRGLLTAPDKSRIIGVEVAVRGSGEVEQITGDLIVDASGRNSKAPEWLGAHGYDRPTETAVNSHVGYATRFYEKPAQETDWKILFINARSAEDNPRGGAIFDIGGGKWMVSLGGLNEVYPPTDEAGFNAFAEQLPSPTLAEALKNATPIGPITGYRIPGSRQRHYEKLVNRPENFILLGDSVCAFNPIYGQGITVAAMEANDLDTLLASHGTSDLTGFAAKYQKHIAKTLQNAWLLATGEDRRFPKTDGNRPNMLEWLIHKYVDRYALVSHDDEMLTLTFIKTLNLSAPPSSLMRLPILLRVLVKSIREWRAAPNAAQQRDLLPKSL